LAEATGTSVVFCLIIHRIFLLQMRLLKHILYFYCTEDGDSMIQLHEEARVRFPALEKKVVGLERGPLSLVSTTEELLGRKSSGSDLENREYGRRDPSR
jgi:hypothetical protein